MTSTEVHNRRHPGAYSLGIYDLLLTGAGIQSCQRRSGNQTRPV